MNFFKSLFKMIKKEVPNIVDPKVDLGFLSFDGMQVNSLFSEEHYLFEYLEANEYCRSEQNGFECGLKSNRLDYIFLTLEEFQGKLLHKGNEVDLSTMSKAAEVLKLFGEPYWVDKSDGEMIQYFEYNNGQTELQFEFSDGINLSHITIANEGVLFEKEQRDILKIDKPWPPRIVE